MDMMDLAKRVITYCREQGWAKLETGISRPVPAVSDGEIQVQYLLYRSHFRPPSQYLYPPFAQVAASYPSGEVRSFQRFPDTDRSQPLGIYPHEAAEAIPLDQWDAVWDELFGLYPEIIADFAGRATAAHEHVVRFAELFRLTTPPFMLPHYRALNPAFFEWLEQVAGVPIG